jgi:hypothetical protein
MLIGCDIALDVQEALVPRSLLTSMIQHAPGTAAGRHDEPQGALHVRALKTDDSVLQLDLRGFAPSDDVRERLRQLYGRAQSIRVREEERGLSVLVSIPLRQALAGEHAMLLARQLDL